MKLITNGGEKDMSFKKLSIGVALLAAISFLNPVMAKDNIFGGVDIDDTYSKAPASLPTEMKAPTDVKSIIIPTSEDGAATQSMNSSLNSIDAATVELRKKLTTVQQEYNEVDKNYKMVKYERKQLKKEVNRTKSRIRSLEKSKKSINKALNNTVAK